MDTLTKLFAMLKAIALQFLSFPLFWKVAFIALFFALGWMIVQILFPKSAKGEERK